MFACRGAETLIDDMRDAARITGHRCRSPHPADTPNASLEASASNAVIGSGIGGLGGSLAAGSASGGTFATTDHAREAFGGVTEPPADACIIDSAFRHER